MHGALLHSGRFTASRSDPHAPRNRCRPCFFHASYPRVRMLNAETFVGNTRMLHMSTGRYTHVGETPYTEQVADMFSSSHAVTSLSIGLRSIEEQSLAVLLNSFPSATYLSFKKNDVIRALCTPRPTDGGYPCPKLRSLKILWRTQCCLDVEGPLRSLDGRFVAICIYKQAETAQGNTLPAVDSEWSGQARVHRTNRWE